MKRGECHESKNVNNIAIAFLVFALLNNKDGALTKRFPTKRFPWAI